MDNTELIAIWKELKSIRELIFQVAMQYEGVQRALEASTPEFKDQRIRHEQIAAEFYVRAYNIRLREIDAIVQRLESSESLRR